MNNKYLKAIRTFGLKIYNSSFFHYIQYHKKYISIFIMITLFIYFGYVIYGHPELMQDIIGIGYINAILITLLYCGVLLSNFGIMHATIRLCRKKLPAINSLLLTIYSTIINFFGPLQSGPAVRAVYLKHKIGLRIRDYTYAMLIYYFSFASFNVSIMFIGTLPVLSLLGIIISIIVIILATNIFKLNSLKKYIHAIIALTIIQIIIIVIIYSIELNAIDPLANYSAMQIISYTGSANLSLFVSLTPGAIGFREAFLVISQSLHNIPLTSIVASGIIDRAIYVIFLAILFLFSSGLHLKNMFVQKHKL